MIAPVVRRRGRRFVAVVNICFNDILDRIRSERLRWFERLWCSIRLHLLEAILPASPASTSPAPALPASASLSGIVVSLFIGWLRAVGISNIVTNVGLLIASVIRGLVRIVSIIALILGLISIVTGASPELLSTVVSASAPALPLPVILSPLALPTRIGPATGSGGLLPSRVGAILVGRPVFVARQVGFACGVLTRLVVAFARVG